MSDPLWFLENTEDNESKSDQNDFTLNFASQPDSDNGQKNWIPEKITSFPEESDLSRNPEKLDINQARTDETKTTKTYELDLLKDEESLRTALQNSLLESIKNGQNPEIQITVNSKPPASTGDTLEDNYNRGNPASQNDNSQIRITLNKKENGQVVGEEKKFVINGSSQNEEINQNSGNDQHKMYVILPPNSDSQSNAEPNLKGNGSQYFQEVGSTVINLNDLISSKENAVVNNGNITADIDLSSMIDSSEGVPKVKLVVQVKDERDKNDMKNTEEKSPLKSYSDEEITRLRELLKNSATLEDLNAQLQEKKERNIPITLAPSTSQTSTWQKTNVKGSSGSVSPQEVSDPMVDWVDKSTDSYVRRDGAQCTRTVWNSPQGRRVETRCFKDERNLPRGRRFREYDWPSRIGSIWNEIDDEFSRIINRFF